MSDASQSPPGPPVAARVHAARDLRLMPFNPEPVAAGQVRVRFGAGGICGSDMHYFAHGRNGNFIVTEPLTLGHELAGVIESVGADVTEVSAGQRIAVNPSRWCGACPRCREGRANLCESVFFMGSASRTPHMQGGFATFFDVHPAQCHPLPDHVSLEAAALAEPLAVCLHAVERAGALKGDNVLIVGAGPIGLLTAMAARHRGAARVVMTDVRPAALQMARSLGFETPEVEAAVAGEVDVAFEAAGAGPALDTALRAVRRGGTVVQIGNIADTMIPVPVNLIVAKEIALKGSQRFGATFAVAVELIASGAIDPTPIIGERFTLAQAEAAFERAVDPSRTTAKIILAGG